jgi:hypothetical protein
MASKKTITSEKHKESLIKRMTPMGRGALTDEYLTIASNIEEALQKAGAIAGKDYTYLDLFHLAQPFVVKMFNAGSITQYDYPSDNVID